MYKFSKILVAVDGSESSMKAADYAIALAAASRGTGGGGDDAAQVIVLNVVVSQLGYSYSAGIFGPGASSSINEFLEKSKQEAQKWFGEIQKKASANQVRLSTEIVASPTSVVPAIVNYAEKNGVDMIVMGTRGRSGISKLLLGSVAAGVVTYAACPVTVVK